MKYIFAFTDSLAANPELSGGKGANLALLTQRAFPVPPGFIISAQAYIDFVTGSKLHAAPSEFNAMTTASGHCSASPPWLQLHLDAFKDQSILHAESERIRFALAKLALPPILVAEVQEQLSCFPDSCSFSVRSSSTLE